MGPSHTPRENRSPPPPMPSRPASSEALHSSSAKTSSNQRTARGVERCGAMTRCAALSGRAARYAARERLRISVRMSRAVLRGRARLAGDGLPLALAAAGAGGLHRLPELCHRGRVAPRARPAAARRGRAGNRGGGQTRGPAAEIRVHPPVRIDHLPDASVAIGSVAGTPPMMTPKTFRLSLAAPTDALASVFVRLSAVFSPRGRRFRSLDRLRGRLLEKREKQSA